MENEFIEIIIFNPTLLGNKNKKGCEVQMAKKKSGGLGRDFEFILDDNMPVIMQPNRKTKKKVNNTPELPLDIKKKNIKIVPVVKSSDGKKQSSELAISKQSTEGTENIIQNQPPKLDAICIDEIKCVAVNEQSSKSTDTVKAENDNHILSRRAAIEELKSRINAPDTDEGIFENTSGEESTVSQENQIFNSALVKMRPDKIQKEGNKYGKATKRTWS